MNGLYADIETVITQAGLSEEASREIIAILNDASDKILTCKGMRLLRFLNSLKTGEFLNLASRKRPFLENFIEILLQNDMRVSRICYLFFDQRYPRERPRHRLPEEMVKRLLTAGRMERVERVKILVWDLLWRQGDQLARLVSPEDIAFALWLDAPLTRNSLIMFMLRHFNADKVMQAICTYTSKTGKRIPSNICRQFIGLARSETELKHRRGLLSNIIKGSELTREEMDRIWPDYLNRQNRFELIRIFSSDSDALSWMEGIKRSREQLSFNFKPAPGGSDVTAGFASRVHAIRTQ